MVPERWIRPLLLSYITTYLAPSHVLFREGAILVNIDGRRFCDERSRPQDAVCFQAGHQAFIVFDGSIAKRFNAWPNFISTAPGVGYAYLADYERARRDILHKAATVAELAGMIGVPAAALEASIADLMHMPSPPYYALGPARAWIVFSEGGLSVDSSLRVLRKSGTMIPRLFAAGSAGQGGLILEGHGHHLAWAFTSGRLAGTMAAG